jgi:hypothetical protein
MSFESGFYQLRRDREANVKRNLQRRQDDSMTRQLESVARSHFFPRRAHPNHRIGLLTTRQMLLRFVRFYGSSVKSLNRKHLTILKQVAQHTL